MEVRQCAPQDEKLWDAFLSLNLRGLRELSREAIEGYD